MERIEEFQGQYRFLSNFWPCEVEFEGESYPSVEHAYQAAKSVDPEVRKAFREPIPAGKVKKMGQKIVLRPDWELVKVEVMRGLLKSKFSNSELKAMLLATGDAELVEGNWWGDVFWGVCKGKGENWLGRLLMIVRSEGKACI